MRSTGAAWTSRAWLVAVAFVLLPLAALGASATSAQEEAVRRLLTSYEQAIETKDILLFRSVEPNLSAEEEKRLEKAFDSTRSHAVVITVDALSCEEERCTARLQRRDALEGPIVSSFPRTLWLVAHGDGFVIEKTGR